MNDTRQSGHGGRAYGAAAVAVYVMLAACAARAAEPPAAVTVREDQGVVTVAARFTVAQPPAIALAVLTDYEQIPRFMPDVRTSVVRERHGARVVVEQEAVSKVMMFSKRVHLILEIEESVDGVAFRDRCGRSFGRYEGTWQLSIEEGQTVIRYALTAEPSFEVPGFILKRLLRRDSGEMIERIRGEIAARGAVDWPAARGAR